MPSLKEVKERIVSVKNTQQITKAMKMVAAAKLKRAQNRIDQMRPYSIKLSNLLANITATLGDDDLPNVYGTQREAKNVLIVLVTSDRGLCGGFNSNVVKAVNALIQEKYAAQAATGNVTLLPIGKKGYDGFRKGKLPIISEYFEIMGKLNFDDAKSAAEYAMNSFIDGTYDVVEIAYNEFKNVATQILKTNQFLPTVAAETEDAVDSNSDYIFEPNKAELVAELIPKALKIEFYKALLDSNAAEHGARMTAMDKATENADELLKELKLTYNRTRQAYITTEILEIVGGAEALSNG